MRVLVGMSGGVDSSVAAALLLEQGHEVVGATLKLWGGASDSGCCSVADVDDARRVAQQLGVAHHVFSFTDDFDEHVVAPYVAGHATGRTPNPCIECNRHLKFDRFLRRALLLGFDAVATGHHARVGRGSDGFELRRGADEAKDQSYVLHVLGQTELARVLLPVGDLRKEEVRRRAADLGLRTAAKPDSQDVCFITASGGRRDFLGARTELHPAEVVDRSGLAVGRVAAVELVTLGQRRGLGVAGGTNVPRYAVEVDVPRRRVVVGGPDDLLRPAVDLESPSWVGAAPPEGTAVLAQVSAHGAAEPGTWREGQVMWSQPRRAVAPGQAVVLYDSADPDRCLGGAPAA
ncbi:MAG: tRNA-specific 2-thiouridylase MnmA [uncultured Acidimicrobiales bacterium]|uniref:tRNA-specific 2-thiouridylase MnmA n=1 Tax=uncultured Acidimicrobiales bacterium TaxID=310071 RepID=A0A6J4I1A0_9ACTN|nr:MAG: tRNA-specific 2-thiouridylase MnmA [uncultured Acidimicrobiales bacterium]